MRDILDRCFIISLSNMVLIIALAHGLFPLIGGMLGHKTGIIIGALIGILFAMLAGGAKYAAVDFLGIAAGFALAWLLFKQDE
ncbi:MAG: hypothetical protein K6E73_04980 [Bacteroidales bacterium]|nr:hypothetical protein [Bacteroidales bacterium]